MKPQRSGPGGALVLVDVGNTNTVFGIFHPEGAQAPEPRRVSDSLPEPRRASESLPEPRRASDSPPDPGRASESPPEHAETPIESFRLSTDTERTADEYGALLLPLFTRFGIDPREAEAVVISSVVPPLHLTLDQMSRRYFGRRPLFIEPGVKTGMPIRYDNPAEVGADRIVNSVAARERYGAPVVVVDFGTATTFDVVNAAGEYAGGIIAPGIGISAEALFAHASRLYRVDIRRPAELIGRNTAGAMQAGIYYGYIGLVDGILERLTAEIPGLKTVVATGGQADLIAAGSRFIREVDPLLTLVGLKLIYDRNRGA